MSTAESASTLSHDLESDAEARLPGQCGGILHIHVAFDWGDEIDLAKAQQLVPAASVALPRRRRTPPSIDYRPRPLRLTLEPVLFEFPELGNLRVPGEVTLFDFGALSVALHVPFQMPGNGLLRLADFLADSGPLVQTAHRAVEPLFAKLQSAIDSPAWSDFSEEYFVFQLEPSERLNSKTLMQGPCANWAAGLVRLESGQLSKEEVAEAIRVHLAYSPEDLIIADWQAAILLDRECDETLQVIEFANLQLLEFRHIDNRLDGNVTEADRLLRRLTHSRFPFWRTHTMPLRLLGELKVEANGLFERTGNVLKLVGDQYLARIYRLLGSRFHLDAWEKSIERTLNVLEGTYQTLSDQAAMYRAEFLEVTVIVLIVLEILLAIFKH